MATGDTHRAGGAFIAADAEAIHKAPAGAGMGLQIAAQLALDGSPFLARRTPSLSGSRGHAALLDAAEQRLAGRDVREQPVARQLEASPPYALPCPATRPRRVGYLDEGASLELLTPHRGSMPCETRETRFGQKGRGMTAAGIETAGASC